MTDILLTVSKYKIKSKKYYAKNGKKFNIFIQ